MKPLNKKCRIGEKLRNPPDRPTRLRMQIRSNTLPPRVSARSGEKVRRVGGNPISSDSPHIDSTASRRPSERAQPSRRLGPRRPLTLPPDPAKHPGAPRQHVLRLAQQLPRPVID